MEDAQISISDDEVRMALYYGLNNPNGPALQQPHSDQKMATPAEALRVVKTLTLFEADVAQMRGLAKVVKTLAKVGVNAIPDFQDNALFMSLSAEGFSTRHEVSTASENVYFSDAYHDLRETQGQKSFTLALLASLTQEAKVLRKRRLLEEAFKQALVS